VEVVVVVVVVVIVVEVVDMPVVGILADELFVQYLITRFRTTTVCY
jgi:hypothetical protein